MSEAIPAGTDLTAARTEDIPGLTTLARAIQQEWGLSGFVGTIYFEFALELMRRAAALRHEEHHG